ncbi:MAG: DUF4178 domain-containing protein [Myxococcales bacterium]|nr:DUF4178 domain-containing protein [Myxococcales bacterium]
MLWYILIGMGVAGLIGVLISRKKKEEQSRQQAREAVVRGANVTNDITGVRKGGVLHLPPFGKQRAPIETYVRTRHRYEDGGAPWYELVCEHGNRELLIEWSREGRAVYVTAGFEDENPSLEDLGLDESKLIDFDEAERGSFPWDGATWHYVESGERMYFEDDGRDREGFYCWEFEDEGESRQITVEKWVGERKFQVYHLWRVDPKGIEIFDAGDGK